MTGPTRDAYGACDPRAHGALGCDDGATNEAPARNGDAMATETPKAVFTVLTNCTDAAREDEFNEWYNNIHLPDVLTTPGIIRATRLGRADETPEGQARYAALYEARHRRRGLGPASPDRGDGPGAGAGPDS